MPGNDSLNAAFDCGMLILPEVALRAKKAGFDSVQIHAAHGYLITQFFSTYSNKRLDEYGGSFWNRTSFCLEIIEDIRNKCGRDFVIDIRLSGSEFVEGGLTIEDTKAIAMMVEAARLENRCRDRNPCRIIRAESFAGY